MEEQLKFQRAIEEQTEIKSNRGLLFWKNKANKLQKQLDEIHRIVNDYSVETIQPNLGECTIEVTANELHMIYKLSIINKGVE